LFICRCEKVVLKDLFYIGKHVHDGWAKILIRWLNYKNLYWILKVSKRWLELVLGSLIFCILEAVLHVLILVLFRSLLI